MLIGMPASLKMGSGYPILFPLTAEAFGWVPTLATGSMGCSSSD
jgi:hypothetical protein